MRTVRAELTTLFQQAGQKAFPDSQEPIEIVQSTHLQFGHYQCNVAMKIGKAVKMAPRAVAEKLGAHLPPNTWIEKWDIAGPGFINITLSNAALEKHLQTPTPFAAQHQRVVVDFSSPNTAKEMHVGHLRSTIIGESIARVFEYLGFDVLRLNHIGDWGTSFGMLIAWIKTLPPGSLEKASLADLMQWYKASKNTFDADPVFKKSAQLEVVALQGGDPVSKKMWEQICAISRAAYQEIYELLDVRQVERGESFYNPLLEGIVQDLEKKGLVTLSDGAKCVYLEGFVNREGESLPLMIQKSDGGYNYDTTDMAALKHRVQVEKANRIIYVTDAGQATHFAMVFEAGKKAGYYDPSRVRLDHVGFGLVLGTDGKKFRTRSGETEKLVDLLQAAITKADTILQERNADLPADERHALAKALGLGAIKYADLSCHRMSDYVFSYDKMLRFEGNTAAFMMYAYVRVLGIKRKIPDAKPGPVTLTHPSEITLAVQIIQFPEALESVANDLLPNRLTDYLYTLAERFHAFFRDCRVEGSLEQGSRLTLCEMTAATLKQGLHFLGISTVEKM